MPQPETLIASLGVLFITATENGYTIVDAETTINHIVRSEFTICTATNMQRAMMRAHEIMEEKEDEEEAKAALRALDRGEEPVHDWEDAKKSLGI